MIFAGIALNFEKVGPIFSSLNLFPSLPSVTTRLQNSPYFCVLKYARTVKQKVSNEAEKQRARLGRDAKSLLSPHRESDSHNQTRLKIKRFIIRRLTLSLHSSSQLPPQLLSYNVFLQLILCPLHFTFVLSL